MAHANGKVAVKRRSLASRAPGKGGRNTGAPRQVRITASRQVVVYFRSRAAHRAISESTSRIPALPDLSCKHPEGLQNACAAPARRPRRLGKHRGNCTSWFDPLHIRGEAAASAQLQDQRSGLVRKSMAGSYAGSCISDPASLTPFLGCAWTRTHKAADSRRRHSPSSRARLRASRASPAMSRAMPAGVGNEVRQARARG